ncbi:MAG: YitT family protein [Lachnospiraceae bacterium]|nr:YitT family protein [Lachnospiraceae bacterium]
MKDRKQNVFSLLKKYLVITVGAFLYAAGIALFLDPNELAPGGVVGISVILSHTIGGVTGTWYFLLNIPIVLLGWWKFGGRLILDTFYAVALNAVFTNLFGILPAVTRTPLLAALAGSILVGTGIGLVFKTGATTGGMDIIIKILRRKYRFLKTGTLFLTIDVMVVAVSGIVFRDFNTAMYAFISVVISGRVLDYVLYGNDEARLIYIVSGQPGRLLNRILEELEIGATILNGSGAYSGQEKEIILCVVKKQVAPKLEEIVKQEDDKAFLVISSANEIYGEGYKNILVEQV